MLSLVTSVSLASTNGVTTRESVASDGTEGNGTSFHPAISGDGRFVAFFSSSSNLVSGGTSSNGDVFVHDRNTGETSWVSFPSVGAPEARNSSSPSISADGRFVAFISFASNLVSGDTNNASDVFVHDRQTGTTERVSVASDGTEGNGNSHLSLGLAISANGRFVVFYSLANNLVSGDTIGTSDAFLHDRLTGQTELVSVSSDGTQGNSSSGIPSISADGGFVAFESCTTNLASMDTNGQMDVFVRDRQTGTTKRVSVASDGTEGNGEETGQPSISGDGRFIAFYSSSNNLVDGKSGSSYEIFVHDQQTGQTQRVSVASDGTPGNCSSDTSSGISADGRFVRFASSANNLVAGDANGNVADIFLHNRQTGETQLISIGSDGSQGNGTSLTPVISANGDSVAFHSYASNLVMGDTNNQSDVFVHSLITPFNFSGFFQPVDNLPTLNLLKAGSAVPVKFSLTGDQGLDILESGYPKSQAIDCDSTTLVDGVEETVTAGSSSLSYDPSTDTYTYVWKTDKGWANTCRQLVLKLNDGTYHRANFKFKK